MVNTYNHIAFIKSGEANGLWMGSTASSWTPNQSFEQTLEIRSLSPPLRAEMFIE